MAYEQLVEKARSARRRAYAPYSEFPVGAAVLCQDGTVIEGVNVENSSSPLSCCAERSAIYAAVSAGHREFVAIAVVGGERPLTPCGGCRQVLSEFGNLRVIAATPDREIEPEEYDLRELLPHAFGKEDMRV